LLFLVAGCALPPWVALQAPGSQISLSGISSNGTIRLTLGTPVTLQATQGGYTGSFTFTIAGASVATVSVPAGSSARRRDDTSQSVSDTSGEVTITPVTSGSTTLTVSTNRSRTFPVVVGAGSGSASPSSSPSPSPSPSPTATPTAPPPGILSANPTTLSFYSTGASYAQSVLVQQTDFSGTLSETDTCLGIATISPASSASPYTATVTPVGAGTCTITFSDGTQTVPVSVTVTTAGVTVSTKGRAHE